MVRRWQQVKSREGRVLLLAGKPGIGKSRLAAALQERLQAESHSYLSYFCSPHDQHSALHPIMSQLEREAAFRRDDTSQQRLDKLEPILARSTDELGEVVPPIADLLSLATGDRYPALNATPQKRKDKTL